MEERLTMLDQLFGLDPREDAAGGPGNIEAYADGEWTPLYRGLSMGGPRVEVRQTTTGIHAQIKAQSPEQAAQMRDIFGRLVLPGYASRLQLVRERLDQELAGQPAIEPCVEVFERALLADQEPGAFPARVIAFRDVHGRVEVGENEEMTLFLVSLAFVGNHLTKATPAGVLIRKILAAELSRGEMDARISGATGYCEYHSTTTDQFLSIVADGKQRTWCWLRTTALGAILKGDEGPKFNRSQLLKLVASNSRLPFDIEEKIEVGPGLTLILKKNNGRIMGYSVVDEELKEPRIYTLTKLRDLDAWVKKSDKIEAQLEAEGPPSEGDHSSAPSGAAGWQEHGEALAGPGTPSS